MELLEVFILITSFLILLSIGVPIAFSIGMSALLTLLVSMDPLTNFATISQRMATGLDSFALLAIPFFILAGQLMNQGGIARRLIDFAKLVIGWLPGGLAHVNIIANMLFGAISGSAVAAASAIGGAMHDPMTEEGYEPEFNASVNIASATTGMIIPPSNILIVYSVASGGVSIGALFVAGYLPGIMVGLALMLVAGVAAYLRKYPVSHQIKGARAGRRLMTALPALVVFGLTAYSAQGMDSDWATYGLWAGYLAAMGLTIWYFWRPRPLTQGSRILNEGLFWAWGGLFCKREMGPEGDQIRITYGSRTFFGAFPSLLLLYIVIGGIIAGVFTATEASAIAVLYTLGLAFLYREITIKGLADVFLKSVSTTSIVMILVATSMAMSWVMAYEDIPQTVSQILLTISDNPIVILLIINLILLVVGVFMDMTPAVLIFTPIFLPVVTELGMDPIHFGIMMVLNLCIGLCTPPVGSVLFVGTAVAKVSIGKVVRPLLPLYVAMFVVLILVSYVPQLSLWLPGLFGL
ncbi:MAG: TRAP transporter large permease [Bacteroidetes bacterium]|nr:MAG: TRAP transporter large permease [Bacteroidota bacterium]